jgi:menaquinone-dependent protoporphyrinogen oxidase
MTSRLVLVAYGSKRGGTAEIARWIGDALRDAGIRVEVRRARQVKRVDGYDAVILGGSVYLNRWHRDARRFARRLAGSLRERPVWLFGSDPLDTSAESGELHPVPGALKAGERIGARGYTTFGGVLSAEAHGFPASMMAKKMAGDYRDPDSVRAWALGIADQLGAKGPVGRVLRDQ